MHIKSFKHLRSKQTVASKSKTEQSIVEALKCYDRSEHPAGESLPDSTCILRAKVVTGFLKAGIPLSKADMLRGLLGKCGYSLTNSTHLCQLIPFVFHQETKV